jgi:glycosyltransferase involved in cell wall biosynthesis
MKIAYLIQMADVATENGISKKILGQLRAWSAHGHDCRWFSLTTTSAIWPPLAGLPHEILLRGNALRRLGRSRELCGVIHEWGPDIIYFRYAYHSPGLPSLFRTIPAVAELNSDDTREYALTLGPIKNIYHLATRRRVLRRIAGFCPVTFELASLLSSFGAPIKTIGNGIPLSDFVPLPPAQARTAPPRLIFIGTEGSPWHGLERLAELADLFPGWSIDVIGISAEAWVKQTNGLVIPPNVTLHGRLNHADYMPLLREATAAVGSLALYKNGMHEACPLKVREYLALGLPVIGASADTDIPDNAEYYLRLPNHSGPLGPQREVIASFVDRWRERRVPRSAVTHLDASKKEEQRLAFMARVLSARAPSS